MFPLVAVTTVFVATYYFIVTERLHRTTIALAGALLVLLLPGLSLSQDEAVGFIDFNTLGLLIGMMLIVAVLTRTGVFKFLALRVAQRGKGLSDIRGFRRDHGGELGLHRQRHYRPHDRPRHLPRL
jgi:Na+/H+ antiporter NhaD/arsenite permease-like protein